MGFEGPTQQKPESVEAPVYRVVELENKITGLEEQKNKDREAKNKGEISMDAFGLKLGEIDKVISTINSDLQKEKDRISPEDKQLLEVIEQEKESLKFHTEGFNGVLQRFRGMQDFEGKPRIDIDRIEYDQLQKELIQMDSDLKAKKRELQKTMEDPIKRGLIRG